METLERGVAVLQRGETFADRNLSLHFLNTCRFGSISKGKNSLPLRVVLFVLRFYGSVNPMGSCRARSVYLTTRLLGRLRPLSG